MICVHCGEGENSQICRWRGRPRYWLSGAACCATLLKGGGLLFWLRFDCNSTALLRSFDDFRYDRAAALRPKQAVREAAIICPRPLQADLWLFDLENGVRVTYDVGYLCANFGPRPLCSRLRPDVRDRQTSDAHHRVMPPDLGAGA